MTIKIRQTPYERSGGAHVGPYTVFPDEVRAQLGVIAMAGSSELPTTLGEDPDPADPSFTVVSYDPGPQDAATPAGRVRQLLKDLVDRSASINLFGLGPDFVWEDGSTLEGSAGGAIGTWILYDTKNCDGDGRWVRGTDGNEVCTTSAGILLHEMGHIYLHHPSGFDSGALDADERAAVGIENDLREAQGLVKRDPNHWHESSCGCPSDDCCIVASVATGSPYSTQVHRLRRIRDSELRNTRFGHHMLDILHNEYYSFSVPICRVMVADDQAKQNVSDWLLEPLMSVLQIAWTYARQPDDPDQLGRLIAEDHQKRLGIESEPRFAWDLLQIALHQTALGDSKAVEMVELDPGTRRIYEILAESLPYCPHIRWGVVELMQIYARARSRYQDTLDEQEVGLWLRDALDEWLGGIPLDYVTAQMTPDDLADDLQILASSLFVRPQVRRMLGQQLSGKTELDPYLKMRLQKDGYTYD